MPQEHGTPRRHPRAKAPKGMLVAWQSGTLRSVSFLESIAMGGLFIRTPNPPPIRSLVKLLIELPSGDVNAQAIVRRSTPTKGMAVEIIAMTQESRAMLKQALRPLLPESSA
jgi:PilZ domain-containing protein